MSLTFTADEKLVLFGSLLAQVEDNHQVVYNWSDEQCLLAEDLYNRLEHDTDVLSQALAISLSVQVHDVDHSDLSDEQWEALDVYLGHLYNVFSPKE